MSICVNCLHKHTYIYIYTDRTPDLSIFLNWHFEWNSTFLKIHLDIMNICMCILVCVQDSVRVCVSGDVRIICAVYTYSIVSYWSQHPYIQLLVIITCTKWYWRVGWRVAAGVGRNCDITKVQWTGGCPKKHPHIYNIIHILCNTWSALSTRSKNIQRPRKIFKGRSSYNLCV